MSNEKFFYGRIVVSVVLYVIFMILSTMAVFSQAIHDQVLLLAGLLLAATFLLPRTPRRPQSAPEDDQVEPEPPTEQEEPEPPTEQAERDAGEEPHRDEDIMRWLMWARISYFVIAVLLWFGLPALLG